MILIDKLWNFLAAIFNTDTHFFTKPVIPSTAKVWSNLPLCRESWPMLSRRRTAAVTSMKWCVNQRPVPFSPRPVHLPRSWGTLTPGTAVQHSSVVSDSWHLNAFLLKMKHSRTLISLKYWYLKCHVPQICHVRAPTEIQSTVNS